MINGTKAETIIKITDNIKNSELKKDSDDSTHTNASSAFLDE